MEGDKNNNQLELEIDHIQRIEVGAGTADTPYVAKVFRVCTRRRLPMALGSDPTGS